MNAIGQEDLYMGGRPENLYRLIPSRQYGDLEPRKPLLARWITGSLCRPPGVQEVYRANIGLLEFKQYIYAIWGPGSLHRPTGAKGVYIFHLRSKGWLEFREAIQVY